MRTALLPKAADNPEVLIEEGVFDEDDRLLSEFADDEDATVAGRRSPARGALVGMMLGAALWGTILLFVIRR